MGRKMEKFYTFYIEFLFIFFKICEELGKNYLSKKLGVTNHPSELNLSKVNAMANSPINCVFRFLPLCALMHKVVWCGDIKLHVQ